MKIIQSFWSKPYTMANRNDLYARHNGGWISEKMLLMSLALSCLRLRELYNEVELVTDCRGKKLFIEELNLPYSKVSTDLENINDYHHDLWAVGKLYTYGLQNEPFLHIDNDIFIWKKFDKNFIGSDIIAQNADVGGSINYYGQICGEIKTNFTYIPKIAKDYVMSGGYLNSIQGYNAGIFGGQNFDFFRELSQNAFSMLALNIDSLHRVNRGLLNVFLEQSLAWCLAYSKALSFSTLFDSLSADFKELTYFSKVPLVSYIHAIGTSKRSLITNEQIYLRLKIEFPKYFQSIEKYCQ